MVQTIKANIEIAIPKNFELIETDELTSLREQSLTGRIWTMADLRKWLGKKSSAWISRNIIDNPRYSKEIQMMRNHNELTGGGRGSNYLFRASSMAAFIDRHWSELPW